MDETPGYSKWRKPSAEPKPQEIAQKQEAKAKYEENEERRKLMMLENMRRRKQKENRLKEQEERKRRAEEQLLHQRKKDKEQAYVKYLRNNVAQQSQPATTTAKFNLYDKYQAKKREELEQVQEIKPASKWNRSSEKKQEDNLVGLDLDVQATKDLNRIKKFYQQGKEQLNVIRGFEQEWEESHELIKSSMLDSLDLDQEAVAKSKGLSKNQPAIFEKEFADMKKSIAFLQIEENIERIAEPEKDIKDLIGYESGSNFWELDPKKKLPSKPMPKKEPEQLNNNNAFLKKKDERPVPHRKSPQKEDGEQLMQQKPSLMGWAGNTVDEAEELFSNCSSNISKRSFPRAHLLKQLNQKITKKMPPITEQSAEQSGDRREQETKGSKRQHENKTNRSSSKEKAFKAIIRKTPEKVNSKSREKDPKQIASTVPAALQAVQKSKQKYTQERPILPKPNPNKSSTSIKKQQIGEEQAPPKPPQVPTKKASKTVEKFRSRLSQDHIKPTTTVCTQDDMLHIDEFIKDELRDINNRELELQLEIKKMHQQSKDKVKEVEQRYEVNTNITSTREVTQKPVTTKKNMSQSQQLQESLYRIEELLIRKEQNIKQLQQQIKYQESLPQQQRENWPSNVTVSDVATPEFNQRDSHRKVENHIDPMASSNELLQQVARLTAQLNNASGNTSKPAEPTISVPPVSNSTSTEQKTVSYAQLRRLQKEQEQQPISKWKRASSQQKDKPKSQKLATQEATSKPNEQPAVDAESVVQNTEARNPSPKQERISVNDRLRNLLLQ